MRPLNSRLCFARLLRIAALTCVTTTVLLPTNAFAAAKLDPCAIVTAADVGAAFGVSFQSLGTRGPVCAFNALPPSSGGVDVTIIAKKNAKQAKAFFKSASAATPTLGKPTKVRGLGDQAIYKPLKTNQGSYGVPVVYVRDGNLLVYVTGALQGLQGPPVEDRGALIAIAKVALNNA